MNFFRIILIFHYVVNYVLIARHTGRAIFDAGLQAKAEAHAEAGARAGAGDAAGAVDTAEGAAVASVGRAQPPVVALIRITRIACSHRLGISTALASACFIICIS